MTTLFKQQRDVALQKLDPTPAQLEHGLALHAEATVVDAYGFSPMAAPDGQAVKQAIEAGLHQVDLDRLIEAGRQMRTVTDPDENAFYRQAWAASGVNAIMQNAGQEGSSVMTMLYRFGRFTWVTDRLRDLVVRAVTAEDIRQARLAGKHALVLTTNGVPLAGRWSTERDELSYVETFAQLGCRMMHLTYNRRNLIGDGCMEPANAGLSDFGRMAIAEMNRCGIIVDVAHSGWQTGFEAARVSVQPLVASHSGAYELNAHPRNKPDHVIQAIAETGGLVGVCAVPAFLGRAGDITALLDHVDYIVKLAGIDHVAIGTDVAAASPRTAEQVALFAGRPTRQRPLGNLWRDGDPLFSPDWQKDDQVRSLAWTNWPIFTVGLHMRGYSDDEVRKIVGGNVLRVLETVCG